MTILTQVLALLSALATVMGRAPADPQRVQQLLELILALGKRGEAALVELVALRAQLEVLADSGEAPDWDALDAALAANHSRLQALKEAES